MSGGSWEYVYQKFEDVGTRLGESKQADRRALGDLVCRIAVAMRAIEWNDSGDGAKNEAELIRACVSDGAILEAAIIEARDVARRLSDEIKLATENGEASR